MNVENIVRTLKIIGGIGILLIPVLITWMIWDYSPLCSKILLSDIMIILTIMFINLVYKSTVNKKEVGDE